MFYYVINDKVLSVTDRPPHTLQELYEQFLRAKGVPNPFTPKADIEAWVKKRDEFMKTLQPLHSTFIRWLIETWKFRTVSYVEEILLEP